FSYGKLFEQGTQSRLVGWADDAVRGDDGGYQVGRRYIERGIIHSDSIRCCLAAETAGDLLGGPLLDVDVRPGRCVEVNGRDRRRTVEWDVVGPGIGRASCRADSVVK